MAPQTVMKQVGKTLAHVEEQPQEALSAAPSRFVPSTMDEVLKTARMFYDGGLMPRHFYEDKRIHPDNRRAAGIAGIATMILYGAELGLSPSQAMRMMHVIEGRATLSSAGLVALIKRSPKCYKFNVLESSDEHCIVETQRRLDDGKLDNPRRMTVKIWWGKPEEIPEPTKDLAYVMPSRDRDGKATTPWARFPSRMLKARACSWVGNDVYEDVVAGLYSAEEVVDFRDNRSQSQIVDNIFDMVAETPVAVPKAGAAVNFDSDEEANERTTDAPSRAEPEAPVADTAGLAKRIEALEAGQREAYEAAAAELRAMADSAEKRELVRAIKAKRAVVFGESGEGGGA